MEPTCFVIQPFDGAMYDGRWRDTYKPAILNAGYQPYRVDHDKSVSIPIEKIEEGIRNSDCIFAELSEDNPNVWLEVGLAVAHGQELCLICSDKRQKFPFDVQHRTILRYSTGTRSDFDELQKKITERLLAIKKSNKRSREIRAVASINSVNLRIEELNCLAAIAGSTDGSMLRYDIFNRMEKWDFTNIAIGLSLRTLAKREFIDLFSDQDHNGNYSEYAKLSDEGWKYIEANTEKFVMRKTGKKPPDLDDDIPF
jgi:hypothetical protein